jgi:uncharacterized protein GlcG (DUF336 family)
MTKREAWSTWIAWAGSALLMVAAAEPGRAAAQKAGAETQPGSAGEKQESPGQRSGNCSDLPSADDLRKLLKDAPKQGDAGGLAGGYFEWAAIVDRHGTVCAVVVSTDDPAAAWPGSQAIAVAKAYTANAFSTDRVPMSTARLYTMAQPGHSLFGAAAANPLNPECLVAPQDHGKQKGKLCGGTIVFGGGVPLYKGKTRVGGLGASGDTPCADHEIAKRIRDKAHLNPEQGPFADDIVFTKDGPSVYAHPLCTNTFRNGKKMGEEPPGKGY